MKDNNYISSLELVYLFIDTCQEFINPLIFRQINDKALGDIVNHLPKDKDEAKIIARQRLYKRNNPIIKEPIKEIEPTYFEAKLTKKALNEFIGWTTSRYNSYLGFGTKKQNVNRVFKALTQGFELDREGNKITIFEIECASPVGENMNGKARGRGASNKYWKTKQAGDNYMVDCINKTITAKYSKRTLKLL